MKNIREILDDAKKNKAKTQKSTKFPFKEIRKELTCSILYF